MAAARKHFLLTLLQAKPLQQTLLLKTVDEKQLLALKELAVNILRGVVKLTSAQKTRLKKFKDFYLRFTQNKKSYRKTLHKYRKEIVLLVHLAKGAVSKL